MSEKKWYNKLNNPSIYIGIPSLSLLLWFLYSKTTWSPNWGITAAGLAFAILLGNKIRNN